ncbi:MAG: hypothetical protein IANPNBLG_01517 [Bryobacteraceae bacterium]|nr:hypothetical protein [Bryobacteraceae bacterium]
MPRRIESLLITGPAGRLEALLEEPADSEPQQAALVCHPHPLHGGTMHNKVVYRAARGLRRSGHAVLRFNFRGVNRSEGSHDNGTGEVDDARAALALLRERYPELPYTIAGFSFGARVALRLAQDCPSARRAIAIGFPAHYPGAETLIHSPIPRIFIHSRHDAICPVEPLQRFVASLPAPAPLLFVEAEDHFFAGGLSALEDLIAGLG